jgi:hypothetical protein
MAEVLMAAAVLAVGLLGLGSLQLAALAAAETARARRVALALVRNALEAGPGGDADGAFDREGRALESGEGRPEPAHFTVTFTRLEPHGPAARHRVEVAWPSRRPGQTHRLVLTRLAAP